MSKQISASIFETLVTWEATSERCSKSSLIYLRRRYFRTCTIFAVQTTFLRVAKKPLLLRTLPGHLFIIMSALSMYFFHPKIYIIKFVVVFIMRELLMFFLGPVCQWHACQIFLS